MSHASAFWAALAPLSFDNDFFLTATNSLPSWTCLLRLAAEAANLGIHLDELSTMNALFDA
jgi:hypothetical protein